MSRHDLAADLPRFVGFAAACVAWIAVMTVFAESPPVAAAGRAWFTTWGIQAAVSIVSWVCPLPPPITVPRRLTGRARRVARLLGVVSFGKIARWMHPFVFEHRSLSNVRDAMLRAQTTHLITFGIVTLVTI